MLSTKNGGAGSPDAQTTPSGMSGTIGVLGGLGPYAGLDLVQCIFDETAAHRDQDHLPVTLVSYPAAIPDRSSWLADPTMPNPVGPMLEILFRLEDAGCAVAGIPCNTAHAPALLDRLRDGLEVHGSKLRIVHIVDAIVLNIQESLPGATCIGVLATNASINARLHEIGLESARLGTVRPDDAFQFEVVNPTIFDSEYGLKAQSRPPSARAREDLLRGVDHLVEKGADAVILGCTELPLAVPEPSHNGTPLINSTRALARALIRATFPDRLRTPMTADAVSLTNLNLLLL
ncbi:aspartate/glutamate racemase family protein [soil metagenome]